MSDKATWRVSALMSAGILTVTYILFVPVDIPDGDPAFMLGFKIGYFGAVAFLAFVPSLLTRFIERRLTNAKRDERVAV